MTLVLLITGTPGTGKTTSAGFIASHFGWEFLSLSNVAKECHICLDGDQLIVDPRELGKKVETFLGKDPLIIEGHMAQSLGIKGITIVLRTDPRLLRKRLEKRGYKREKIDENLEAEAVDICLLESLEEQKEVYEIDTTNKSPEDVLKAVNDILNKRVEEYLPGRIDWLESFVG